MTLPPLTSDTYWAILKDELDDDTVNQLVWHHLGYRYDSGSATWNSEQVDPDWREAYPEPPRFTDSRPPTVRLTRSIPKENKQLLKTDLGFTGYTIDELEPRKTRRATVASWLMSCAKTQSG